MELEVTLKIIVVDRGSIIISHFNHEEAENSGSWLQIPLCVSLSQIQIQTSSQETSKIHAKSCLVPSEKLGEPSACH